MKTEPQSQSYKLISKIWDKSINICFKCAATLSNEMLCIKVFLSKGPIPPMYNIHAR